MIQFPGNPVALMGQPFDLALAEDASTLYGLESIFGDAGGARVLLGAMTSATDLASAFEAGALTFQPVPMCTGAGAVNLVGADGHKVATAFIGSAR